MITGVIEFPEGVDVSREQVAMLREMWRSAQRSRRDEVLMLVGATYREIPAARPRAAFLRRARSRVR